MNKLQEVRKSRGLSQSQLAKKCDMKTSKIQHYEIGWLTLKNAHLKTILTLALALECKMEDIIEEGEELDLLKKYFEKM